MKPVGLNTDLEGIIDNESLMMLNWDLVGIRYIMQLIALTKDSITTTGIASLPAELWNIIIGFALANTQNSFCFVQGISLQESSMGKILHCRRVNVETEDNYSLCASLASDGQVYAMEEFMDKPNRGIYLDYPPPTVEPCEGDGDTFDILITSTDDNLPVNSACLFSYITVPDVVWRMENGACGVCGGSMYICPGCTGGAAQEFGVFMGCGVELVCPLCMGLDFSLTHKQFLQDYYWDDPTEEEQKSIDDWIERRIKELCY